MIDSVPITRSLEETMEALEKKLPQEYWIEIHRLLVTFGKHVTAGLGRGVRRVQL